MPILPEEPWKFPESLFSKNFPHMQRRVSWAVYTKPRQEKSLARELFKVLQET